MVDPFGRAVEDHHRGERAAPLLQCDGPDRQVHPIEAFYFTGPDEGELAWLERWVEGPLLDVGAGAGRLALAFQGRVETVAVEVSGALVETMGRRGVRDARAVDMFGLPDRFAGGRFGSLLAVGTQTGLAGSREGLRGLLADFAAVTGPDGHAVIDSYDPEDESASDLLGHRSDPTPGLGHRVMWFEYEGETGPALQFRLFGPEQLREAVGGTAWEVRDVRRGGSHGYYRAALGKP